MLEKVDEKEYLNLLLTSSPSLPLWLALFKRWFERRTVGRSQLRVRSTLWHPGFFAAMISSVLRRFISASNELDRRCRHSITSYLRAPSLDARSMLSLTSISLEGSTFSQLPHLTLYSFNVSSQRDDRSSRRRPNDP